MPSLWCSIWESAETGSGQPSVITHGSSDPEDFRSLAVLCYKNDETKLQNVIQLFISQLSSLCVEFFPSANPELVLEHIQALQELAVRSHNNHIPIVSQSALRLPATLRSFKLVGLDLAVKRLSSLGPMYVQLTNIEIIHNPNALLHLLQLSPVNFLTRIWDTQAGLAVVQAR
ncbi:hypothetical protein BDR03DRAFT_1007681 [Suillus americanus]|nr:hypothetical protein BDR03DRAFT_1007681 [Suillus americanus]